LFQTPLRVDAYPGSLLERQMVQWERWRMKEWGFSFGTLKSKMEAGAIIAFWEPDPKIVHESSPQLATYAFAHTNKLKISSFENRVFTIKPTPGDRLERYCLSKGSDERITSYGTFYVVYLGGVRGLTATDQFWTLEHHQTIDWMMRDMDPAGTTNMQNEGVAMTPPVDDLLKGMTFTPGGVQPVLDTDGTETRIQFNPAAVGSANNILITVVTTLSSLAGVQIPFETQSLIQGVVHEANEAMDDIDPEAVGELVSQYICGGSQICRIALKGATAAVASFAVAKVKAYISTLPGDIISLRQPEIARYQPPIVAEIASRTLSRKQLSVNRLTAVKTEVCSLLYDQIDVESLLTALPNDKINENMTSYMADREYVNTGLKPSYVMSASQFGDVDYLSKLEVSLKGGAVGDYLMFFMKANSPHGPSGGTAFAPLSYGMADVSAHWWNDPTNGYVYMVGGRVTNPSALKIQVLPDPGTTWATFEELGHFDLELHYSSQLPVLLTHLKGKIPITTDGRGLLAIDKFAASGSLSAPGGLTLGAIGFRDLIYNQYANNNNALISGVLLNHLLKEPENQSYVTLRNLPTDIEGWLHFHFDVTHTEPFPGGWQPYFNSYGTRASQPSVREAFVISETEAIYMFKMKVPKGTGMTGILWEGPVLLSGNYTISNFYFGFNQSESVVDERLSAVAERAANKCPKKKFDFHKL